MQFDFPGLATKRLLDTQSYKLVFDNDPEVRVDPRYAILSHRWSDTEVEFYELTHSQGLGTKQEPRCVRHARIREITASFSVVLLLAA